MVGVSHPARCLCVPVYGSLSWSEGNRRNEISLLFRDGMRLSALTVSPCALLETLKFNRKRGQRTRVAGYFVAETREINPLSHFHFEIKRGKRGSAAEHIRRLMRAGNRAGRDDPLATGCGNLPECTQHRPETFFKLADEHERVNGSAYRAITISLPRDLTTEQNLNLAHTLVEALADSKPYLFAFRSPVASLEGGSNPHLRIMISDRLPDGIERPPEQISRRYNAIHPARGGWKKDSGGMTRLQLREKVLRQREFVADTINEALAHHGHASRVDHRSLRERGVRRKPERYLGPARIRAMSAEEKNAHVSARRDRQETNRRGTGDDNMPKPTFDEHAPATRLSDDFVVFGCGGLSSRRYSNY